MAGATERAALGQPAEIGAILLERNEEWQLQHGDATRDTMAGRTDERPTVLTHIAA